jgi:hypothetical protein
VRLCSEAGAPLFLVAGPFSDHSSLSLVSYCISISNYPVLTSITLLEHCSVNINSYLTYFSPSGHTGPSA